MLDVKRYESLLVAGQRRRAELDKGIEHLRGEYEKHGAAVAELQNEKARLTQEIAQFDRGQLNLSETELSKRVDRLRWLDGALSRAIQPHSAADAALKGAENDARGIMTGLRGEALTAWKAELYEADREYKNNWLAL